MTRISKRIGLSASLIVIASFATSALAGPVELLPGRWAGWGKMTTDNGKTERVKCVATYFREGNGSELRHNMRCASTNYKIDAVAKIRISGRRVSGEWNERIYSNKGAINGAVRGDGINVSIAGDAFEAKLNVETTACKQTIAISPKGMGVKSIKVKLAKC